jgi:branched-chain amino acid transport system substrate-binding protein
MGRVSLRGADSLRGKRFLTVLSLLSFFVMGCFAYAQETEQEAREPSIRVGAICSLTGQGSLEGRNLAEGLQTLFDYVNHLGGVSGKIIALDVRDDGGDPDRGVTAARQLLADDGVVIIASTSGAATTVAIMDQGVLTNRIPVLAGPALSVSLSSNYRQNTFFFGMPYGDQVVLAVEHLLKESPGMNLKMGFLGQEGYLGGEVLTGFRRVCGHYGLPIVGETRYSEGTDDFNPSLQRLQSAGADHVILGATSGEAARIMSDASNLGWNPQFIGPSSTAEAEVFIEEGDVADGFLVVDYLALPQDRAPGVALMLGATEKSYPKKDVHSLHRSHVLGYVSGLVVVETLRGGGREPTRGALIQALEGLEDFNTHGLAGVVSYKKGSRISESRGRVLRFDSTFGTFFPLTDWSQPMLKVSH